MKVETTQTATYKITEVKALDLITVYCENFEPGKGKITVECYGQSWSAYWGGMSGMTVERFFCSCDDGYISGNFGMHTPSLDSHEKFGEYLKKEILKLRRNNELSSEEAKDYWFDIEHTLHLVDDEPLCQRTHEIAQAVIGDEWWYAIPKIPNPDYQYLCRIIKAVQEALNTTLPAKAA